MWKYSCIISIKKLNKKDIIVFLYYLIFYLKKMEENIIFKISVISDIKLVKLKIKN